MSSTFEVAARAALAELISKHAQESKFGYILTKDAAADLISDLYQLLQTSRELKGAGDRLLGTRGGARTLTTPTARPRRPLNK